MKRVPVLRLSTHSLIIYTIALLVGITFVVLITNYQIRQEAIKEADRDARAILMQNDAINSYFAFHLRPHIFKYVAKDLDPDYFGAVWMSAGYAVRNIFNESQKEAGIIFKISSPNARTAAFAASPYELGVIRAFEQDKSLKSYSEIREINGKKYLTVMRPGQMLTQRCMRCHSSPDLAPKGLVDEYGPVHGFNRKVGTLSSALTVHVPLDMAFKAANSVTIKLSGLLIVVMATVLGMIFVFNRHFVIRPIAVLTDRMEQISHNDAHLGETVPPSGSLEFHQLANSFNTLSAKLKMTLDEQEEIIEERTRELTAGRARFRAMFENMQNGVAVFEPSENGKEFFFLDFNTAAERIENIQRESLIGRSLTDAFPSTIGTVLVSAMREVWETGQPVYLPPAILREGPSGWRENYIFKLNTGEIVSVYNDVTEREQARIELLEAKEMAEGASKAKGEFLANMSHEIRTPLNGVFGLLQLLKTSGLKDEQEEYVKLALSTGNGLLQIINDVLDFSRMEQNALTLVEEPFDPREPIDLIAKSFAATLLDKRVHIETSIDETLPDRLIGDGGRLRQILFNLVGNAAKFTERGHVLISLFPLHSDGETVLVGCEVEDTGSGISEDKINDIFSPFVQADLSMTKQYQGTGLGLGIVRKLVNLMGGSISVVSTKGEGSTFLFTFKARIATPDKCRSHAPEPLHSPTARHILVAEDDHVNQLCLSRFLEKMGHTYMLANDGAQALELLRKHSFDGVLMDIQMPNLNGLEATKQIRSGNDDSLPKDIPIIALTAFTMAGDRERVLEAGMTDHLTKPVTIDSVQQVVDCYFGNGSDQQTD